MGKSKAKKNSAKKQLLKNLTSSSDKDFFSKILEMQEEERRRISRDLHDETGQMMIGLGASLNVIEKAIKNEDKEKALSLINESRELMKDISSRMKAMAFNLRPPTLDILGLSAVLREYFWQCCEANTIRIEFNENIKDVKLDEKLEITIYRIIQEAIYNVLKHSHASVVKVTLLLKEKNLELAVEDDGRGFNIEEYKENFSVTKMGLSGIAERVRIAKGEFTIESTRGKGTKLKISLPL